MGDTTGQDQDLKSVHDAGRNPWLDRDIRHAFAATERLLVLALNRIEELERDLYALRSAPHKP